MKHFDRFPEYNNSLLPSEPFQEHLRRHHRETIRNPADTIVLTASCQLQMIQAFIYAINKLGKGYNKSLVQVHAEERFYPMLETMPGVTLSGSKPDVEIITTRKQTPAQYNIIIATMTLPHMVRFPHPKLDVAPGTMVMYETQYITGRSDANMAYAFLNEQSDGLITYMSKYLYVLNQPSILNHHLLFRTNINLARIRGKIMGERNKISRDLKKRRELLDDSGPYIISSRRPPIDLLRTTGFLV